MAESINQLPEQRLLIQLRDIDVHTEIAQIVEMSESAIVGTTSYQESENNQRKDANKVQSWN
jgi:hypothetical protein